MPKRKITVMQVSCKNLITKQNFSASFWLLVLQLSGNTNFPAHAFFYRYRKGLAAVEQEIGCSSLNRSIWNLTDSCIIKAEPGSGHWVLAESSVVATVQITKVVLGRKEGQAQYSRACNLMGGGARNTTSLTYIVFHFIELLIYCTHWLLTRICEWNRVAFLTDTYQLILTKHLLYIVY